MKDFQLTYEDQSGTVGQSFLVSDDVRNNIILSLSIRKGDWWFNPNFGLPRRPHMKNIQSTANLIRQDIRDALQWIIDAGRATHIDVVTSTQSGNRYRLKAVITAVQSDGRKIIFTTFVSVGDSRSISTQYATSLQYDDGQALTFDNGAEVN